MADVRAAEAEANKVFGAMCQLVEECVAKGDLKLDVVVIAQKAGLTKLDADVLAELKVDRIIHVPPWLPYHICWPWRPIWCWYWRGWPYYRCCPYWWTHCHYHLH